jgi:hypothetical protein
VPAGPPRSLNGHRETPAIRARPEGLLTP